MASFAENDLARNPQECEMYASIRLPWSVVPSKAEEAYRLAGLVRTQGTLFLLPPDQSVLAEVFNAPPRPKTRMSSGAVALCKHFERGDASSEHGKAHPFWPLPKGSNDKKTQTAAEVLDQMMRDAQWKNMMMLHRGVAVYEIRNGLGYGMRWTLELDEDTPSTKSSNVLQDEGTDDTLRQWQIRKTLFRGFLEPIIGLDHELPRREILTDQKL
ncbi:hypothetical protein H2198_002602 [Neophaeococcomyces mojaviensis]|uniref:Uncharacterized protein n=1 Tax=Neophaeococcomyces mojaviensis TaxID=3383035 RepID=A0ACC3AE50_9EURO|nr:hypothetical protein H2198_002602 [Knufia sp. JES_112]